MAGQQPPPYGHGATYSYGTCVWGAGGRAGQSSCGGPCPWRVYRSPVTHTNRTTLNRQRARARRSATPGACEVRIPPPGPRAHAARTSGWGAGPAHGRPAAGPPHADARSAAGHGTRVRALPTARGRATPGIKARKTVVACGCATRKRVWCGPWMAHSETRTFVIDRSPCMCVHTLGDSGRSEPRRRYSAATGSIDCAARPGYGYEIAVTAMRLFVLGLERAGSRVGDDGAGAPCAGPPVASRPPPPG